MYQVLANDELTNRRWNLREALRLRDKAAWTAVEVHRTSFRLFMVLRAQGRFESAREIEQDEGLLPQTEFSLARGPEEKVEERMQELDFEVSIWHGRSEGLCKPRLAGT